MSEMNSNPDVARALAERDAAHAAFSAPDGPDATWQRLARQLSIAQAYGTADGKSAYEIKEQEREARIIRDAAWDQVVVPANEALVRAQHRVLAAGIAAERRAAGAR
ncbi:hypothetical protein [Pseudonocardia charpentierae]|uniref:Uncharacterized protein n=1 Tax=Pseudonocardia charpentierae TaxID=3075545 RepID=A0ABU2NIE9_9PSEU|nr:hypothetical protein [Pseudonocardia sp. DSM 45834]MDT0353733.1 hypothetical protein [Pseudonocardia sp. DSM 45834]